MKILVNVYHSNLDTSSVNSNGNEQLRTLGKVTLNLQYFNYPDFEIDIEREQRVLSEQNLIVFQYLFLWYSVPLLMKKRMAEVLTYNWAYGPESDPLKNKIPLLTISKGCAAESCQTDCDNDYSITEFLRPIEQTIRLTEMTYLPLFLFHNTMSSNRKDIDQSAEGYLRYVLASTEKTSP